jgi:CheY-like chemotaxis protein
MPALDGWAVAPLLRAWAGERLLLLIALTGLGGRQAEENSLYAGFDHHILKPGDPQALYEGLANFITRMESAALATA